MKRALGLILVNAVVSYVIAVLVVWNPPRVVSPQELTTAINQNARALTRTSESVLNVVKRLNEIAPPSPVKEAKAQ